MLTKKRRNSFSLLPGPKGLPILGNLLQIDFQKLHLILEEWSDLYGEIYKFKIVNKTVVAISDPTLIQNILRDRPQTYRRVSSIERVARELGIHGVFSAEGEQWQRQRQLTMQAFKPERWLESNPTACAHNRNASAPFGAGPRFCPGRNLALLEIKMAMAMLCKNFSITRVETGRPVQEIFSFTMMPDKLLVTFEARRGNHVELLFIETN
jgi:cytochrome P450